MKVKDYSKKRLLGFYETMYKMRRFEEEVFELYKKGLMAGLAHLYMGQEAIGAGVMATLEKNDYIGSHHRGHGHLVARGSDMGRMMAEILGRKDGYCRGKGGSMHIMDMEKGVLGANGIVGAGIPITTGSAYTIQYDETNQIAVCFMGDSATNEGVFHEALNMAAAWKLPCLYIIENNLYGISVDIRDVTNTEDLADRAKAYGIPGQVVDGMDILAVYESAKKAVDYVRSGNGPMIIEYKTYRWQGHHVGDPAPYRERRSATEKEEWMARCPVQTLKEAILTENTATAAEIKKIEDKVENEVKAAVDFAINNEYPDAAEAYTDLFA